MSANLAVAQTLLFVPGSRPDRFPKAVASAADLVILDLEDAVNPADRAQARRSIAEFVASATPGRLLIRVNQVGTADGAADLQLLESLAADAPGALAGIAVPKAESRESLEFVSAAGGGVPVLALVETVRGLKAAASLVAATDGPTSGKAAGAGSAGAGSTVVRLAFGALDFGVDAGGDAPALLDAARVELVFASRLSRAPAPVESPSTHIEDLAAVDAAAKHAVSLGFGGMLAIHPAQLPSIEGAFRPTADEVAWARRVVEAGDGAVKVDGAMVDAPVLQRARKILAVVWEAS